MLKKHQAVYICVTLMIALVIAHIAMYAACHSIIAATTINSMS